MIGLNKYEKKYFKRISLIIFLRLYQRLGGLFSKLMNAKFIVFKFNNLKLFFRRQDSDFDVFRHVFIDKQYDLKYKSQEPVEFIIDLGCNNGFSVANFKKCYPQAKIIAVDPDTDNIKLSKLNTSSFDDIIFEQKAIWHEETDLEVFSTGRGSFALNVISNGNKVSEIKTTTIPALMENYGFPRIDILKIDIEGAEYELFRHGNKDWLGKVKVIFIECHDRIRKGCTESLFKALYPYSFSVGYKGESFVIIFN